jgi:threonine/homoserine/homoserine lactone efflux protein
VSSSVTALFAFGVVFGLVSAIPTGPIAALIVHDTLHRGARAGFLSLAALLTGELCYVALFGFGFSQRVLEPAWVRYPLLVIGSAVMLRSGYQTLRRRVDDGETDTRQNHFLGALLVTLTNPSILVIFSTLFAATAEIFDEGLAKRAPLVPIVGMEFGVVLWFSVVIILLTRLPERLRTMSRAWADRGAAVALLGFGGWLLVGTIATWLKAFGGW